MLHLKWRSSLKRIPQPIKIGLFSYVLSLQWLHRQPAKTITTFSQNIFQNINSTSKKAKNNNNTKIIKLYFYFIQIPQNINTDIKGRFIPLLLVSDCSDWLSTKVIRFFSRQPSHKNQYYIRRPNEFEICTQSRYRPVSVQRLLNAHADVKSMCIFTTTHFYTASTSGKNPREWHQHSFIHK